MTHVPSGKVFAGPLISAAESACRRIPPAFPLDATVAVNPYLGHAGEPMEMVAARMARIGGPHPFMPRAWYRKQLECDEISRVDLETALVETGLASRLDVTTIRSAAAEERQVDMPLPTVADLLSGAEGRGLAGLAVERISAWAQSYFDEGQAMWRPSEPREAFANWREYAVHDLTPEFRGLDGFCARVRSAQQEVRASIEHALSRLGLGSAEAESYCHQLLLRLGGWAQAARLPGWKAEQVGTSDTTLLGLLAAMLVFETACYDKADEETRAAWKLTAPRHGDPVTPSRDDLIDAVLQAALEAAHARNLGGILLRQRRQRRQATTMKAFFCIDVRSEVFRRALESVSPEIETGGFAGFFGVATAHRRFASDTVENRLPVLLAPQLRTAATGPQERAADLASRIAQRAHRALARFSSAAVASFAYVEAAGLAYGLRLARGSTGRPAPKADAPAPRFDAEIPLSARVAMAGTVLRAMSLTDGFPAIVLLVGHGAGVVNAPFASALHCGACGGHAGDVNARMLAGLLNEPAVRAGLREEGIGIPEDTVFVAGLHDTTADTVDLFADDAKAGWSVEKVRKWLDRASAIARTERVASLPGASRPETLAARGKNWAELRPEWGLAGCAAFIAAPRAVTRDVRLDGRAFLHDYDWTKDENFSVLQLILTAPVVVASWISLQYYGSVVAPEAFGSGNKLLHNVVGGMGVVEGNGGVLRTGLSWQSVHDGTRLIHRPLRLTVAIAAPPEAISDVLGRNPGVCQLFDNGWLKLFALDEAGRMTMRYGGALKWQAVGAEPCHAA